MLAAALLFLRFGWSRFDLATNNNALYTFSFLMLLYFAAFSVLSARERHWFWSTIPKHGPHRRRGCASGGTNGRMEPVG